MSNRTAFDRDCAQLFKAHCPRLLRYFDRLSGDPELAADLTQEAFVRLYGRNSLPDQPEAWLLSVAMNLFRNAQKMRSRRRRLLTIERGKGAHSDAAALADERSSSSERLRVRAALAQLAEREQQLLLLRMEGYSYRDMAMALDISESSIGTLLARAKQAFRAAYLERCHAP